MYFGHFLFREANRKPRKIGIGVRFCKRRESRAELVRRTGIAVTRQAHSQLDRFSTGKCVGIESLITIRAGKIPRGGM